MECEFNRTPYKRRLGNYSGHEHLTASMQQRKYGGYLQNEVMENSKMPLEVHRHQQYLTIKSSGACQTRVHGTVHMAYFSRIRDGTWPMPYICCNYS
jgi:hypothetical protein